VDFKDYQAVIHLPRSDVIRVAGLPLLAHAILLSIKLGITKFTVCVPHTRLLQAALPEILQNRDRHITIRWIEYSQSLPSLAVDSASEGVPATQGETPQKVLLIMASGIASPDLFKRLNTHASSQGFITSNNPNSLNSGFWKLSKEEYEQFRQSGRTTVPTSAVPDDLFCPVNQLHDVPAAERQLFRWSDKTTDGIISRHLNRPVSRWISRHIAAFDIRPNEITVVTTLFTLLMFYWLVAGTPFYIALGCFFYQFISVIDGVDGEIARVKYLTSSNGALFDTASDMAGNILFIIGVSIGLTKLYGQAYIVLGGYTFVIALTSVSLMSFILWIGPGSGSFDVLQIVIRQRLARFKASTCIFNFINALLKRDLFAFAFALLGVIGFAYLIPWLLATGVTIWLAAIIVNASAIIRSNPADSLPEHVKSPQVAEISK